MARRLFIGACIVFLLLWSVSLAQDLVHYLSSAPPGFRYMKTFDVNFEISFYTWLSASALLTAGLLLFTLADGTGKGHPQRKYFIGLGIIFFYLSADETLSLHERLGKLVPEEAKSGAFHFGWVIPALVLVAIVGFAFLRFLLMLPRKEMLLMIFAGILFIGGAVGMEMIGGLIVERFGEDSLAFKLEASVEEGLEAAGVLLFIHCLLSLLSLLSLLGLPGAVGRPKEFPIGFSGQSPTTQGLPVAGPAE